MARQGNFKALNLILVEFTGAKGRDGVGNCRSGARGKVLRSFAGEELNGILRFLVRDRLQVYWVSLRRAAPGFGFVKPMTARLGTVGRNRRVVVACGSTRSWWGRGVTRGSVGGAG